MRRNPEFLSDGETLSLPSSFDVTVFREAPHYWAYRELHRLRRSMLSLAQYGWMLRAKEWEAVHGPLGAPRQALGEMWHHGSDFALYQLPLVLRRAPTWTASLKAVVVGTSEKEWVAYREQHGLLPVLAACIQNPALVQRRLEAVMRDANELQFHHVNVLSLLHERAEREVSVKLPRLFGEPTAAGVKTAQAPDVLVPQRGERFDFERALRETAWCYSALHESRAAFGLARLQNFAPLFHLDNWRLTQPDPAMAMLRDGAISYATKHAGGNGKGLSVARIVVRITEILFAARPAMKRAFFWAMRQKALAGQSPDSHVLQVGDHQAAMQAVEELARRGLQKRPSGAGWRDGEWLWEDWNAGKTEVTEALVAAKVWKP